MNFFIIQLNQQICNHRSYHFFTKSIIWS